MVVFTFYVNPEREYYGVNICVLPLWFGRRPQTDIPDTSALFLACGSGGHGSVERKQQNKFTTGMNFGLKKRKWFEIRWMGPWVGLPISVLFML